MGPIPSHTPCLYIAIKILNSKNKSNVHRLGWH